MSGGLVTAAYIVAAILFIFSLAGLSKHETSRQGNNFGIAGMAIALIATIFGPDTGNVGWIDLQRVLASNSPANRILLIMGEWLAVQRRNGQLSDILFISLNDRLNDISAVLAGCERIAYTPIPFAYTLILHRTVYLFCIMLPFALVVDLHYMTPFISVLISYTFISLDCLAEELEDPFGTENNDLPLDAICNAIEIDLLQMNDEAEIPAKILPDRHYQLT